MQDLTINDVFDLALKTYNIKIKDQTEEQNIKRKIRRALNKRNIQKPYKLTYQQAEWIIEYDLRTYLLNKSLDTNSYDDLKEFNQQLQQNQAVQPITQTQAEILIKLNHIMRLLGDDSFFEQPKFDQNYQNYISNIFSNRMPKPKYQKAKDKLLYSKYFFDPLKNEEKQ